MQNKWKSWGLVGLQFGFLGLLIAQSHVQLNSWESFLYGFGGLVGLWAIAVMGIGNFNVIPDVKENAVLIHQHKPYCWIRHPMYTSFLLICLGLVFQPFEWLKLLEWCGLVGVLTFKSTYEETLLKQAFEEYQTYCARTKRFVPYVF